MFFFSCQKDVSFNDVEKAFLAAYKVGDTLVFESNQGQRDTVWIIDKDISSVPWDFFNHNGEYKYLIGEVYYGSNKYLFKHEPYPYDLLSIHKSNPDSITFSIHMNDAGIFIRTSNLDKYKISDITYLFYKTSVYRDKEYANYLYWNMKYGVVKFMDSDSVVWRRINIDPMPKEILSLPDIKDENQLKRIRARYKKNKDAS